MSFIITKLNDFDYIYWYFKVFWLMCFIEVIRLIDIMIVILIEYKYRSKFMTARNLLN